jgi:hypothetical protein
MRAYHPAGLALAAFLLAGPVEAQTLDPELTRAAQCAGIIKGAATVELALGGDERETVDDYYFADIYFLGTTKKVFRGAPSDDELLTYMKIHSVALGEVLLAHKAGEWDSQDYGDVITCYAEAGIFFIDELPNYSLDEDDIRKASAEQLANIKILFGVFGLN